MSKLRGRKLATVGKCGLGRWVAFALVFARLSVPAAACAQEPPSQSAEGDSAYQQALEQALAEYRLGNFTEAEVYFRRAHELRPNARTLRGLGIVSFELRRYVEAHDYLRAALREVRRPLDREMRAQAEELAQRAANFIGRLSLRLDPGATLQVDGEAAELRDGELWVDAGTHELAVTQGDQRSLHRVRVKGGAHSRLDLRSRSETFAGDPAGVDLSLSSESVQRADVHEPDRTLSYVLAGGGAAAIIAGSVFGGLALAGHGEAEDLCPTHRDCSASAIEARDDAEVQANVANVAFLGGGLLVGIALWLWLSEDAPTDTTARPAPRAGPVQLGWDYRAGTARTSRPGW